VVGAVRRITYQVMGPLATAAGKVGRGRGGRGLAQGKLDRDFEPFGIIVNQAVATRS
jgi:hypothetical protein